MRGGSALGLGVVLLVVGFLPLLGGPRYEAGLVAGLVAPVWASLAGAWAARARERTLAFGESWAGSERVRLGWVVGGWHASSLLGVAAFHGARVGFCEPLDGFAFLVLGPCVGTLLGGLWGALSGLVAGWLRRPPSGLRGVVWLVSWALSLPVALALAGLAEFYFTPAVFVFSPQVGYFAGPLYEPVTYPIQRLATYRVGSLFTLLGVAGAARWVRTEAQRTRLTRPSALELTLVLGAWLLSASHASLGAELGHRATASGLERALGGRLRSGRCEIVYDRRRSELTRVERLARDCDAHLLQIAEYFEHPPPAHVRVYLFPDEAAKARGVGVGRTYVAKPWRREIYLQEAGFPHPVLGHELAHVVAGEFGRGPFHVAGRWAGWWPDPGRIEGFAVAAAPREDSDATLAEWARAMRQLERLPSLERLFQVGFFGESAARSYMAAGAFVDFVHGEFGGRALREWYGGATLGEATGVEMQELARRFDAHLDDVSPAPEILAEAAQRFSGAAIFERRCPHWVDRASSECEQLCTLDADASADLARQVLELDPSRFELEVMQPRCLLAAGDAARAELRATELLDDPRLEPWQRRALLERRGDARWRRGDRAGARDDYERALAETPGATAARQLEVRLLALQEDGPSAEALQTLLVGEGGPSAAALALGRVLGGTEDAPLAAYLAGRLLLGQGQARAALPWLARAARSPQPLLSVAREAARSWLLAAAEVEDLPAVADALARVRELGGPVARRMEAERLARRVQSPGR